MFPFGPLTYEFKAEGADKSQFATYVIPHAGPLALALAGVGVRLF